MTPFDRLQAMRGLSYAAMAACATTAIVVTTDEPYSSFAMRLARMSAIAPLLGALAVFAAAHHAIATGESLSLRALGLPPWRVARGAVLAAWLVAAAGVAMLVLPVTDVGALFPTVASSSPWVADASGNLVSTDLGVRVAPGGLITFVGAGPLHQLSAPGRWSALALVAPAALVAPVWAVLPASWTARIAVVLSASTAGIVALHLVATGRATALACVAPAVILGAHAASGLLRGR